MNQLHAFIDASKAGPAMKRGAVRSSGSAANNGAGIDHVRLDQTPFRNENRKARDCTSAVFSRRAKLERKPEFGIDFTQQLLQKEQKWEEIRDLNQMIGGLRGRASNRKFW